MEEVVTGLDVWAPTSGAAGTQAGGRLWLRENRFLQALTRSGSCTGHLEMNESSLQGLFSLGPRLLGFHSSKTYIRDQKTVMFSEARGNCFPLNTHKMIRASYSANKYPPPPDTWL